jgi:hypothetical protein
MVDTLFSTMKCALQRQSPHFATRGILVRATT